MPANLPSITSRHGSFISRPDPRPNVQKRPASKLSLSSSRRESGRHPSGVVHFQMDDASPTTERNKNKVADQASESSPGGDHYAEIDSPTQAADVNTGISDGSLVATWRSRSPVASLRALLANVHTSQVSNGESAHFQLPNCIASRPGSVTLQPRSSTKLTACVNEFGASGDVLRKNGLPLDLYSEDGKTVTVPPISPYSTASQNENSSPCSSPLPSRISIGNRISFFTDDASKGFSSGSIYPIRLPSFSSRAGFHGTDDDDDMPVRRASQMSMTRRAVAAGLTCPSKLT